MILDGEEVLFDECDAELVARFSWRIEPREHGRKYVQARSRHEQKTIRLHRLIMGDPKGMVVDHINGNGLDNRRGNLRICTDRQNKLNAQKRIDAVHSKFKGVCRSRGRFHARIKTAGRWKHLGSSTSEIEAARAYDAAASKEFGQYARLNF